jgi:hypothetical protein
MSYNIAYDTARAPPRGAALVAFMEDFYRTSDTESLHEKYVQSFTEDATLIMGPKEAKGTSGMFGFFSLIYLCRMPRWTTAYATRLNWSCLYRRFPVAPRKDS